MGNEIDPRIAHALSNLSPEQRQIIMLIAEGDLTMKEIADELNIPAGTVSTRLLRARNKIKRSIQRSMIVDEVEKPVLEYEDQDVSGVAIGTHEHYGPLFMELSKRFSPAQQEILHIFGNVPLGLRLSFQEIYDAIRHNNSQFSYESLRTILAITVNKMRTLKPFRILTEKAEGNSKKWYLVYLKK